MGLITKLYLKRFICRYDKAVGIPYYSVSDFSGLHVDEGIYKNELGVEIHYFFYYFDNYQKDKIIFFSAGMGPGHTAYLKEISVLAEKGFRVLTYDYMGCEESSGENMRSLNQPTKDALGLLDYLKLQEEVVAVGHSLGGYTSLNLVHLRKDIHKAVIISGFLSVESLIDQNINTNFVKKRIFKYEKKMEPELFSIDNLEYLKNTDDKLLFIHSRDDQIVPYDTSTKLVEELENPNISFIINDNRKHNPNYSEKAIRYMNSIFGPYEQMVRTKQIQSDEDTINYFKNVSLSRLVEQDEEVINGIINFIK